MLGGLLLMLGLVGIPLWSSFTSSWSLSLGWRLIMMVVVGMSGSTLISLHPGCSWFSFLSFDSGKWW